MILSIAFVYLLLLSPFLLSESISIALLKEVIFRALLKEEWSWIYYFLLFYSQKKISQETAPRRNQRTVKGGNASIMQETSRLGVCHLPSSVECCGLYHDGAEDIYNKLQGHDSAAQPSPAQPQPSPSLARTKRCLNLIKWVSDFHFPRRHRRRGTRGSHNGSGYL